MRSITHHSQRFTKTGGSLAAERRKNVAPGTDIGIKDSPPCKGRGGRSQVTLRECILEQGVLTDHPVCAFQRWLRGILLVAQPPLLCKEGNPLSRFGNTASRPGFSLVILFLLLMALPPSALAQSQFLWSPAGPPGDPDRILALASDPRNNSVVYLASSGGVWKTQDGGATWVPQLDSARSSQVCSLALDPSLPDVLYLGTGDNQLPRPAQGAGRSADGGRSWTIPRTPDEFSRARPKDYLPLQTPARAGTRFSIRRLHRLRLTAAAASMPVCPETIPRDRVKTYWRVPPTAAARGPT